MKRIWHSLLLILLCLSLSACFATTAETVGEEQENQEVLSENEDAEDVVEVEEEEEEPSFVSPYTFTYPDAVRGIYVTGHSAGGARFERLLELVNSTDLNAMVIDIKDDYGYLTFQPTEDSPYFSNSKPYIKDIQSMLKTMEEHQIYPIARIVVFKDSVLSSQKPELSFLESGHVWKNRRDEAFVNPFLQEVWDYNIGVAKLAAELGFQEIQFDYVRFPEGFERRDNQLKYALGNYEDSQPRKLLELKTQYKVDKAAYDQELSQLMAKTEQPLTIEEKQQLEEEIERLRQAAPVEPELTPEQTATQLRVDAVTDFVAYAKEQLEEYQVDVSVDIFGYTATLPEAPGIGQNFSKISEHVDVISSMIYPSHWTAYFGIAKPDLEPYKLVTEYIKMETERLTALEKPPISRPWIQDFTASWLGRGNYKHYGVQEIEDQIRALNEVGVWEFLLWNAGNNYTPGVNYTPLGKKPWSSNFQN